MITCGECKHCIPEDCCGCDCHCTAKDIEVSKDDDIRFYGESEGKKCEAYEMSKTAHDIAIMDEYAAWYNSGLPRWAWV